MGMIIGILVGLGFEGWSVYCLLSEGDFMCLIWSLLATIIVRFVFYANNRKASFWFILVVFLVIPILAYIVKQYLKKESTQQKMKICKSIHSGANTKSVDLK